MEYDLAVISFVGGAFQPIHNGSSVVRFLPIPVGVDGINGLSNMLFDGFDHFTWKPERVSWHGCQKRIPGQAGCRKCSRGRLCAVPSAVTFTRRSFISNRNLVWVVGAPPGVSGVSTSALYASLTLLPKKFHHFWMSPL